MASVKSLGLHQPTGLRHAVQEGLLPPDPPPASYTWEFSVDDALTPSTPDDADGDLNYACEDELLTTATAVLWSRGGLLRKTFRFDSEREPVIQSLLTYFPAPEDEEHNRAQQQKTRPRNDDPGHDFLPSQRGLCRALVVFLKTQAHIFMLSGTSHVLHLPFEVESACAAPVGVIIQRKAPTDGLAPVTLRLPRVPPNSFMTSLPPAFSPTSRGSILQSPAIPEFSTEAMGNLKTLPLRLSSTLENMWQPPMQTSDSRWPRLVCLTDPWEELGLIVTHQDDNNNSNNNNNSTFNSNGKPKTNDSSGPTRRRSSLGTAFLHPAEEILHVQQVRLPGGHVFEPGGGRDRHQLLLAVTVNRDTNRYSIWRLSYIPNEDRLIGRLFGKKKDKTKQAPARRRTSMAPGLSATAVTPLNSSTRESMGATMPGKRKTRKSEKKDPKSIDSALLSLDPDMSYSEASRRQSRRVSSLLARADLSVTQAERPPYIEQPMVGNHGHGTRRLDSHGSFRSGRFSGGGLGTGFNPASSGYHALPPVDTVLEELGAGGDFEGFHSMGLDDQEVGFDGLTHEVLLVRLHSFPVDNVNFHYSSTSRPARTQTKVFIMVGPPCTAVNQGLIQLLVGIQDMLDKRLQLLMMYAERRQDPTDQGAGEGNSTSSLHTTLRITPGELRRAQSVVDSCVISDGGEETIMILSEDTTNGHRELSLQAPWSQLTKIQLPPLFFDSLDSLDYAGRYAHANREVRGRRSINNSVNPSSTVNLSAISSSSFVPDALCHPKSLGVLDLKGKDDVHDYHRIRIKLRPTCPQARRILDACRGVLPCESAEKMLSGWWNVMQWRRNNGSGFLACSASSTRTPESEAEIEWSSLVILLVSTFFALDEQAARTSFSFLMMPPRPASSSRRTGKNWDSMMRARNGTPFSSACPPWMRSRGWQWLLDQGVLDKPTAHSAPGANSPGPFSDNYISHQIRLALEFMASPPGITAFGSQGYLPTAPSDANTPSSRMAAAKSIILGLHLLHEEQKLNIATVSEEISPGQTDLRALLRQLASWLHWQQYEEMYELGLQGGICPQGRPEFSLSHSLLAEPPTYYCVYSWIQRGLVRNGGKDAPTDEFPTLGQVYASSTAGKVSDMHNHPRAGVWAIATSRTSMFIRLFSLIGPDSPYTDMVVAMHQCGFTPHILESLPEAILVPLQDAILACQPNPPPSWGVDLLALTRRPDISSLLRPVKMWRGLGSDVSTPLHTARWDFHFLCTHLQDAHDHHIDETEGAERQAVVRTLFKEDRRLNEAQGILATHKPRVLRLVHKPEWSDSEYLERQKQLVMTAATGTLAIPAGRGMLYYALRFPLLIQKSHMSGFNLTCIVRPAGNTVGVDKSLFTEEKINWAFFHQGVATGLGISPQAKGINTSWIMYNKPGGQQDASNRHAGFLLALGLNGHLKTVAKWVTFKYLTPKNPMTTIGLMLGLAASHLGTMDATVTRMVSIHVTRLLPRGSAELNLTRHTQTAGIMSIGLLHCGTQHRRMSEVMVSEIEHLDDQTDEDPLRDEGYRLAAGFALGLINLGKGQDLKGLRDIGITEKLLAVATTTKRVELVHVLDRSAAGAVVAIALVYLKTGDRIVARKVDVPESPLQFDYVRPDVLLLRTVAKHLILWDEVEPSPEWIKNGLPAIYKARWNLPTQRGPTGRTVAGGIKLKTRDLPFHSILAGLCFTLGLRFAGSGNPQARDVLLFYLDGFMALVLKPFQKKQQAGREEPSDDPSTFDAGLARSNARMCMDLTALACATVMAGTGDVAVLRRLRALHGRDDPGTPHGSHLAAHLAVGALFLGCGTATFGTNDLAVASLLMAFYPLFPVSVQDNRAHLQAFRHFWVMAVDSRCLVTKDLSTGVPMSMPVLVTLKEGSPSAMAAARARREQETKSNAMSDLAKPLFGGAVNDDIGPDTVPGTSGGTASDCPVKENDPMQLRRQTPCLLPPLDDVVRVRTDASALGYWDLALDFGRNPKLKEAFALNQSLCLRRRPAHEAPFPATLRALSNSLASMGGAVTAANHGGIGDRSAASSQKFSTGAAASPYTHHPNRQVLLSLPSRSAAVDPLEWVFTLPALYHLTHAERASVMPDREALGGSGPGLGSAVGGGGGGTGGFVDVDGAATTTAVDVSLVLRSALDCGGGWNRDMLLGLRLLFEWAEKRRGLAVRGSASGDGCCCDGSGQQKGSNPHRNAARDGDVGDGKNLGRAKTKKAKAKGKKKVSLAAGWQDTSEERGAGKEKGPDAGNGAKGGEGLDLLCGNNEGIPRWWLRDGVIEELKGRAWLVGRGG